MSQNFFFLTISFFLLVPGIPLGFLDGFPLNSEIDWIFFGFVLVLWRITRFTFKNSLQKKEILIILFLAIFKIGNFLLWTTNGLVGKYYCNTLDCKGICERSIEYPKETRVDKKIDFNNSSYSILKRHFRLHFWNSLKYNFYGEDNLKRESLPFSVVWQGWIFMPNSTKKRFYAERDGYALLCIDNEIIKNGHFVELAKGNHNLILKYATNNPSKRSLKLMWSKGKDKEIIPSTHLFPNQVTSTRFYLNKLLFGTNLLIYFIFLISIGRIIKRANLGYSISLRSILLALYLFLSICYTYNEWRMPSEFVLSGGDDWLTYESMARDILLDDPIGKDTFYYSPFYPYFLAFLHIVFGEELIPIIIFQYLLVIFIILMQLNLSKEFGQKPAGIGVFLTALQFASYPRLLLPVTLATFLLISVLYLFKRRITLLSLNLSGFLLGISCIARPNFLVFLPCFLIFLLSKERRLKSLFLFFLAVALPISLVVFRNYIVSHKPVLTTNLSVNLWLGNHPPQDLVIDKSFIKKYPFFIKNNEKLVEVCEYIRHKPLLFIEGLGKKLLYCFGFKIESKDILYKFNSKDPVKLHSSIIFWLFSLAGMAIVILRKQKLSLNGLLFSVIFLHLLGLCLFFPWTYRRRLIAPIFPLLNIYSGFFLFWLKKRLFSKNIS